jgi:hypothetical protein
MPSSNPSFNVDDYAIEVSKVQGIEHLKQDWIVLEQLTKPPFFLNWYWVSCWVESYKPELISVIARKHERIVAIGLFTDSTEIRHGFIRSQQWRLHQTGIASQDQIWMEFNDFLCAEEDKASVVEACLGSLSGDEFRWDEIIVSMMPATRAEILAKTVPGAYIDSRSPCYSVDLCSIRNNEKTYLSTLSANTRHQINRSVRLYEKEYGDLKVIRAETTQQALEYFHQAGEYHCKRWHDSGYKNPDFINFHEILIKTAFDKGHVELISVKSGDSILGILYYHTYHKNLYFYLQGIDYKNDKKLKPGLVAHTLATDYFTGSGYNQYHYMGGYSQYKKQLAQPVEGLATVVIQRPRSRFKIENIARKLKKRIMSNGTHG